MLDATLIFNLLAWGMGFAIVSVFSWNFFNAGNYFIDVASGTADKKPDKLIFSEPLLPKYATSQRQYRKWFIVFLIFTTIIYVFIYLALKQQLVDAKANEWYTYFNQIFAALIISGFVNVMPKQLQFLDLLRMVRDATHRRAKIPEQAVSIIRNIMDYELNISATQIEKAIEYIGAEYLTEDDFINSGHQYNQNTIEKNWAKTCHLRTCIDTLSNAANSRYSNNLNRPELVYEQAKNNFEIVKEDVKKYKSNINDVSVESLQERTRFLLKQFSKLIVCLVFASEPTDKEIFSRLKGIGINLRKRIRYELKISIVIISMLIFAAVTFVSTYALAILSKDINGIDSDQSLLISLAAVLIICFPIMLVFVLKALCPVTWPVRGQYSEYQLTPTVTMFFFGVMVGLIGFYLISYTGLLKTMNWYHFWPYTMMSGVISSLSAIVIDFRPRVWNLTHAGLRAVNCGVVALLLFFVIAIFSVIVVNDVKPEWQAIHTALTQHKFVLFMAIIVGFMSGVIISLLGEYSVKIRNKDVELLLNVSEYLLPKLGFKFVIYKDCDEINKQFSEIKNDLPNGLYDYLVSMKFINEEGSLTNNSIDKLKANLHQVSTAS